MILTIHEYRTVYPWVIVESLIAITLQCAMQVDVEPLVARDHPPAKQIGIFLAPDVEIRVTFPHLSVCPRLKSV
jgi:hypothetical protein